MGRERWITIGSVKTDYYIFEMGHGSPGGYYLHWKGRQDWCQPFQFREWEGLVWAVKHRCKLAGLKLVTVACAIPPKERLFPKSVIYDLKVLVRRKMGTTTIKLKFLRETELARYYEHPVTHKQQWVPKSVCPNVLKFDDQHEVKIKDWWLKQNPFDAGDAPQDELF